MMLTHTDQKSPDRRPTVRRGGKANNRHCAECYTSCVMITLNVAKQILNDGENVYNDEQVKSIMEFLTFIAEQQIITEKYKEEKAK